MKKDLLKKILFYLLVIIAIGFIPCLKKEKDTSDNKLLASEKFELGKGVKQTTYESKTFTFSFSVNDLEDENIYIRYGASGEKEDDWINKNVKVRIMFTNNI